MGDRLISSAKFRGHDQEAAQTRRLNANTNGASASYDSESVTDADVPLEENLSAMSLEEEAPSQSQKAVDEVSEATWSEEASTRQQQRSQTQTAIAGTSKETRQRQEAKASPKRAHAHLTRKGRRQRQPRDAGGDAFFAEDHGHDVYGYERPLKFINLRDLDHQAKIERDPHHGQFPSTVHRCHKPLHDIKIRVQLLQYASGVPKQETSLQDEKLAVLEERIFSWQEKVFSEAESHFYHDKRNLSTETDFTYHERLKSHPGAVGNFLYTYVHSDKSFVSKKSEQRVTVRRCPAIHAGAGQSSVDMKQYTGGSDSDNDFDAEVRDYGDILSPKQGLEIFKRRGQGLGQRSAGTRAAKQPSPKQKEKLTNAEEGRKSPGESDQEPGSESDEGENGARGGDGDRERNPATVKKKRPAADSAAALKTSARYSLKLFGKQSIWSASPDKCELTLSKLGRPQQVMYIMASLPIQNKKRRKVVVGSIRAYPRAGVILIKPSLGFRNIEPTPSHRYRLCWELFSPSAAGAAARQRSGAENLLEDTQRGGTGNFYAHRFIDRVQTRVLSRADGQRQQASFMEQIGDIFETVPSNEFRVQIMGEVVSAAGFENSPLTIHYYLELPKGWRNEGEHGSLGGVTHCSQVNANGVAHFSQDFCFQLAFSMDSVEESETYPTPVLYLMATCIEPKVIINYEGYAHVPIPSRPGFHSINSKTWKPKPVTVVERLEHSFVNITPGLAGAHAVHGRTHENEECRRLNRLGLQTISSGSIQLRLHAIHHSASPHSDQRERLQLLEKMGSATILKSVQTVIEAFQRARQKASNVTTTNTLM